ncbi:M23 family metallopeptidase [Brevibacillus thermoruber]|uniref:M23 family metallopeptidase n=1 Tax=Brevibacillus thermoruber TaxID=33942 RepID=UPI004041E0CB
MLSALKEYRVTSPYGYRQKVYKPAYKGQMEWHTGIDLAHSYQYPIKSFTSGKVIHAQLAKSGTGLGGFGVVVMVEDRYGAYHMYAHLDDKKPLPVKVGQTVESGQVIGYMGNTGNSVGIHLHYEVRAKGALYGYGKDTDPVKYLEWYMKQTKAEAIKEVVEAMKYVMSEKDREYTKAAIDNLAKKGLLNNPDDWKKSVDDGTVYQRLPMFTAVVLDRVSGNFSS